jgi:hypothetical protein
MNWNSKTEEPNVEKKEDCEEEPGDQQEGISDDVRDSIQDDPYGTKSSQKPKGSETKLPASEVEESKYEDAQVNAMIGEVQSETK